MSAAIALVAQTVLWTMFHKIDLCQLGGGFIEFVVIWLFLFIVKDLWSSGEEVSGCIDGLFVQIDTGI